MALAAALEVHNRGPRKAAFAENAPLVPLQGAWV